MTTSDSRLSEDPAEVEDISPPSARIRVTLEITVALLVLVGIYYLFAPKEAIELPAPNPQEIDPIVRSRSEAAQQPPARESTPAAPASAQPPRNSSPPSEAPPRATEEIPAALAEGEAARRLIAELRAGGKTLTADEILRQAEIYQRSEKLTDAYLLLFYAARRGDGKAAFALATLSDPNHFKPDLSPLTEPDPTQARKWYGLAASQGIAPATQRLQALRDSLETQALDGDPAAQRLLLNWP